jgi:hypothetical protein
MSSLVPIVMFGWVPVVLAMFLLLPPRRAVITAFLAAWLFLPMAGYSIPGIPDYTKMTATCYGALFGLLVFDTGHLFSFRPHWVDCAVIMFCGSAVPAAIANGWGLYDGLSFMNDQVATWGLPYFIGRLYFRTLDDLRELAIGLFIGGLIYVPFCLYEIKMSPQLHRIVYGYLQHSWGQTKRFGGWRPMVFMQHGLMVGMWMCMTALVGFWLWITGSLRRLGGWPVALLVAVLILTALLCKSFGAIALLAGGMAVFASIWMWRTRWLLWALIAAAPAYMVARAGFDWHPDTPLAIVTAVAGPDRAESWQTRIDSEDDFIRAAWQKPFTGWRHWFDTKPLWTGSRAIPDGLWTTILVQMGFPALLAFVLMLLLPVVLFVRRYRPQSWLRVDIAPAAALAMVLVLYLIDCVSNAMVNPLFTLVAGGLASVVTARVDVLASASAPATRRAKPILNLPSIRQPRTQ